MTLTLLPDPPPYMASAFEMVKVAMLSHATQSLHTQCGKPAHVSWFVSERWFLTIPTYSF